MPHSDIFEFHGVHQMVQRHVGIAAAQAREQGSHEAGKGYERIASECAEQQIEPNHVGLKTLESFQQAECAAGVVERPAAQDAEPAGLDVLRRDFVGQNGKAEKRITLQLLSNVKTIFAQSPGAGGKSRDQTDLHFFVGSRLANAQDSMCFRVKMLAGKAG